MAQQIAGLRLEANWVATAVGTRSAANPLAVLSSGGRIGVRWVSSPGAPAGRVAERLKAPDSKSH